MSLQSLSDQHLNARRLLALTATATLTGLWRESVDPDNIYRSWGAAIPRASEVISEYQTRAARDSQGFMSAVLDDAGLEPRGPGVNAPGFAGFTYPLEATPARMLEDALLHPAYRALDTTRLYGSTRGMGAGLDSLVQTGATAVSDAGRQSDGVVAATEPQVMGYVREVEPGACSRCMILAGRRYRVNEGFLRHPNCLCTHTPIVRGGETPEIQDPYDLFNSLSESDQNRLFTEAGAQAIRDGADIFQVVNARRGMSTTEGGSLVTSEGMVRTRAGGYRGNAGRTMARHGVNGQRMMPEEIYKRNAGNQRMILAQLERYGYILPGGQQAEGVLRPQLSGWYGPSASENRAAVRQGR